MPFEFMDEKPPHPGAALQEELNRRGWNQTDLGFILGSKTTAINPIIKGRQGVSPAMSKALGEALGLPPDYFAALQRAYDLAIATDPDPAVSVRARMLSNYPVREMIRRGWLRDAAADDLTNQLARFFEVNDAGDIPHLAHAAKKTGYDDVPPAQLAWLFRVRQVARAMPVAIYSQQALTEALPKLRSMLIEPEEARNVPRILSECGVRFIIVEPLPSAKIDGVCFWLDAASPVIGLSLRFDRIDNFWFVLRHEIEHVLRGHGKGGAGMIDADLTEASSEAMPEERVANEAAADFCVPTEKMESFIRRKNPFFYEKDVLAFSKLNGIHPGLAVGQLQRRMGKYDYLKRHQVKIRQFILPGAIVDGWGQTLPL
ncbi:MAG: ImmA/IrrE family metallo-endopeptidase [Bauldia sp.]|nr:ImmA/IrrE family metallo-endopeptidase [Bauldia sp.]